jgi:integrase
MGQVRRKGVRKEKTCKSEREAKMWEAQQWSIPDEEWGKKTRIISLLDWANDYLEFANSKFSVSTYDEKRVVFRRLFEVLDPSTPVASLSRGKVLDFLRRQNEARSGYAANKDRKNLVAAWNWGIKYREFPTVNPCIVDRFPEKRQIRYVPPEEDFLKVYGAATGQDQIMLMAYIYLAARRGELFRMRWEDVNFDEKKVRLWTRKRTGGNLEDGWLPIMDDLSEALSNHKRSSLTDWVFPDPETGKPYLHRQRWMKTLCLKAGVKPFGIHAIRHLTASILARNNKPLIDIRDILRHKNLATTERYIGRLDNLRSAVSVLSIRKSRPIEPSSPIGQDAGIESAV